MNECGLYMKTNNPTNNIVIRNRKTVQMKAYTLKK